MVKREDVIFDPEDERVQGLVGKKVYCGNSYSTLSDVVGVFQGVEEGPDRQFNVSFGPNRYNLYNMIAKVKTGYRPFRSSDEFAPYRDRWVRIKDEADIYRVESYNGLEVEFSQAVLSFTEAFECCEFDDGTPFGVLEEGQDDQKRD